MEKILEIKEILDGIYDSDGLDGDEYCWGFSGYHIITNKQVIRLVISSSQYCCESWGYFLSEDNPQDFIGAELKNITLTDVALNTSSLPKYRLVGGAIMFVNLETDKGTLQFAAYNAHNGHYGHLAKVESIQLTHEEDL